MPSVIRLVTDSKIFKKIFNSRLLNGKLYSRADTRKFVLAHTRENHLNRYDTIVRLLAVEHHFGENDVGWPLYLKMQEKRQAYSKKHIKDLNTFKTDFEALIKSMEQRGYDKNHPILTNNKGLLADGSHRLACALYFKIPEIELKKNQADNTTVTYGLQWFKENDFTSHEIDLMLTRFEKII